MNTNPNFLWARGLLTTIIGTCLGYVACASQKFEVRAVSSRPDVVSGGDVLVQVKAPRTSHWSVHVNGLDVTQAFHPADDSADLLAIVSHLKNGRNLLEIRDGGVIRSKLEILNHPLSGPNISGPHQEPFICQTAENGLDAPYDIECDAKTVIRYYYKSTEPEREDPLESLRVAIGERPQVLAGFKAYDLSKPAPSDLAQTVTSDGQTVNFVVRREIGTINRAVYDIQFLHQPDQSLPTPWKHPTPGWNGRLVYLFGGGCGAGNHQGTLGSFAMDPGPLLAQGYAVATSTLNIFKNTCNDRVSAETLSMVKEHFIKEFGEPIHTIGWGVSGGAVQQYLIAQNYPGLLDGIIPGLSFPDQISSAHMSSITDCALLDRAFNDSNVKWADEQKAAVSGFATWRTCEARISDVSHLDPKRCYRSLPKSAIYDWIDNPHGLRCDLFDNETNVFGRNPNTGIAYRSLDNVGVQYGLIAFNAGEIDAEQFIELNERIGGYNDDGDIVSTRTKADAATLPAVYQRGLVLDGGGGLGEIPIIDWRPYSDDLADVHVRYESLVTRARLVSSNGNANNQVIIVDPRVDYLEALTNPAASLFAKRERDLVKEMDRWLDNVSADHAAGSMSEKIARDRPSDLVDGCWAINGERIVESATYDEPGRCNEIYRSYGDPRIASGAPLTEDILKCVLRPVSATDYSYVLSEDQMWRLRSIFPGGVCDYHRPGVGQQAVKATWQRYPFDARR